MTMTVQEYSAARVVLHRADDVLAINQRAFAVFWTDPAGSRLLLFNGAHLVWTERKPTRSDAIDAAFAAARRLGHR